MELTKIKSLYRFPFAEQTCTPPVVYFLCNKGKIVYVGQSTNVATRIQTHLNERLKVFTDVYFIPCHLNSLSKFESCLIRHFKPEYNFVRLHEATDEGISEVIRLLTEENVLVSVTN